MTRFTCYRIKQWALHMRILIRIAGPPFDHRDLSTDCQTPQVLSMTRFIFGVIVGASLFFLAMQFHVVRGSDGVVLVPKTSNRLTDLYVDTRDFELTDWRKNKPLAVAILRSEHSSLLADASLHSFRESTQRWVQGFFGER
jgi:hypothetical protein